MRARLVVLLVLGLVLAVGCSTAATPGPSASPSPSPQVTVAPTATGQAPTPVPSANPTAAPTRDPGPWQFAGRPLTEGGMAVALAGGKVLDVPYMSKWGEWYPPTAMIWDPATNTWTATTFLERPRSDFAIVALADGRALVIGGTNAGSGGSSWTDPAMRSYSSAYAFDPDTETWSKVGLMEAARTAPGAIVLSDGRVLVAGGYFHTGPLEDWGLWPAEPEQPPVILAAYRPGATTRPSASLPPREDVDVAPYGLGLATVEIFDPVTNRWSSTGSLRYARVGPQMAILADGRVLVVGSRDYEGDILRIHPDAYVTAEIYDPATGRFTLAGRLPPIDHAAIRELGVTLPDDEGAPGQIGLLVAQPDGGAVLMDNDRSWKHQADVTRTFRFDLRTRSWTQIGQPCAGVNDWQNDRWMSTPCRESLTLAGLPDGTILSVGGGWYDREGDFVSGRNEAWLFLPESGEWTALPPMPRPAGYETVALRDGSVLIYGGCDEGDCGSAVRYVAEPRT